MSSREIREQLRFHAGTHTAFRLFSTALPLLPELLVPDRPPKPTGDSSRWTSFRQVQNDEEDGEGTSAWDGRLK
jgi:hypothetical protein